MAQVGHVKDLADDAQLERPAVSGRRDGVPNLQVRVAKQRGRPLAPGTVATPRRMAITVSALRSGRANASPTPSTIGCGSRTRLARPRNQLPLAPRGAMALVNTTTGLSKPARSAGSVAASPTSTRAHPRASSPTPTEKLGSYVKPSA